MLPKTTQATETEVEGTTTVSVDGVNAQGESLQDLQQADTTEKQTTDSGAEEAPPEKAEPESQPSEKTPRVERRTEKLIDNLKARTDEVSELRKQLDQMRTPVPQQDQSQLPPWFNPMPQSEITPEEYQAHVADTARNLVKSELTAFQSKVLQYEGFKEDLSTVESKYPILNRDSESYDPVKTKTVTNLFQKAQKADPDLRLADFVDDIMSFHQAGQEDGKKEIKSSVLKREAEAAVTPNPTTGDQSRNDADWDSMTLKDKEDWMKKNGVWD